MVFGQADMKLPLLDEEMRRLCQQIGLIFAAL